MSSDDFWCLASAAVLAGGGTPKTAAKRAEELLELRAERMRRPQCQFCGLRKENAAEHEQECPQAPQERH